MKGLWWSWLGDVPGAIGRRRIKTLHFLLCQALSKQDLGSHLKLEDMKERSRIQVF